MWQRFNFFIALESAFSIALFGLFKEKEGLSHYAFNIAVMGVISSICWYVFSVQDRLAALYREYVKDAGEKIADSLGLNSCDHVGDQTTKLEQK